MSQILTPLDQDSAEIRELLFLHFTHILLRLCADVDSTCNALQVHQIKALPALGSRL